MKEIDHELISIIRDQLGHARQVLVITHQRPDGDAIGSLLAVGLALRTAGKDVQMVIKDGLPENFRFLEGSELIITEPVRDYDQVIVVDSAEIERTNTELDHIIADLNIDHHKTNTYFARVNLVSNAAVATSEILADYLPELGYPITKPIADALLTGIVTDTIGFRTTNVNSRVLRLVASLMDLGGNLPEVYYKTVVEQTFASALYWGAGLAKIKMEDGLVWTTLSLSERRSAGYPSRDDADLIKVLSAIEAAIIAVILTEQTEGYVKISWRLCGSAETGLDVSDIAKKFGGGGHKAAAGADVKGNLSDVLEKVIAATKASMSFVNEPVKG